MMKLIQLISVAIVGANDAPIGWYLPNDATAPANWYVDQEKPFPYPLNENPVYPAVVNGPAPDGGVRTPPPAAQAAQPPMSDMIRDMIKDYINAMLPWNMRSENSGEYKPQTKNSFNHIFSPNYTNNDGVTKFDYGQSLVTASRVEASLRGSFDNQVYFQISGSQIDAKGGRRHIKDRNGIELCQIFRVASSDAMKDIIITAFLGVMETDVIIARPNGYPIAQVVTDKWNGISSIKMSDGRILKVETAFPWSTVTISHLDEDIVHITRHAAFSNLIGHESFDMQVGKGVDQAFAAALAELVEDLIFTSLGGRHSDNPGYTGPTYGNVAGFVGSAAGRGQ